MKEMDPDITLWILEFLARQPVSKLLLNKLITNTHVPMSSAINNPRFKKTLTLRSIQDEIANGTSETILESLEIIEELDKILKIKTLDSMKKAYCAVALDCTMNHLLNGGGSPQKRDGGEFFEAVKKIWRERIEKLETLKKSELVTDELREVKEEMEAALHDSNAYKRLFERDTRHEAVRLLKEFLREAMDLMGPSFLEAVARADMEMVEKEKDSDINGRFGVKAGNEVNVGVESGIPDKPERTDRDKEHQKNDLHDACNCPEGSSRIMDSKEADMTIPSSKYNPIPTPEINKVKEALKSSSMELKTLVEDPLPDALHHSEALMAEMGKKPLNDNISVEKQNAEDVNVPNPSTNAVVSGMARETLNPVPLVGPNASVAQTIESIQTMKNNYGNLIPSHQSLVPKHSLMERNNTACTYEWNDSIDGSPEERANLHLDSPRRKIESPLRKYEVPKFVRRRKIKRWSVEEEDALREGVQRFGAGSWKAILNSRSDIFDDRTEVDLKDKWRNMTK
ncbi:uncharacterized protein LOC105629849 [Jatropha curcas]|uniref:uncharacterized protein LOC105629849 n=1 Tax=Jatropha curcas TaxID=180498 RepID=UPI0005FB2213|nr:uncharacterized protein LOC105629849 [Jatropha curcas]XP_012066887.1 uncharacterized protein LOC105629849 [Jatropha curcas]